MKIKETTQDIIQELEEKYLDYNDEIRETDCIRTKRILEMQQDDIRKRINNLLTK